MRGHDVGGLTAVGHDAVNPVGAADVLAQQSDGHLRDRDGVGRVDAELRERGSVGFLTGVVDVDVRHGQARKVVHLHRCRVDHHRRVDTGERPAFEHVDLAAAALFGRRAHDLHRDAEVVGQAGQCQTGANRGAGDDVVAARVTDTGKGVVLGTDGDGQRTAAGGGDERGGHVTHTHVDGEPAGTQRIGDPLTRLVLLERQLGIGVDEMRQLDERVSGLVEGCGGRRLGITGHGSEATPARGWPRLKLSR